MCVCVCVCVCVQVCTLRSIILDNTYYICTYVHSFCIYLDMNDIEKFLQSFSWMFMRNAGAKEVASELRRRQVIPEPVETEIERALDRKTANGLLYDHLYAQGTFQTLEIVCDVFIGGEGYSRMNQLGERMKEELTSQLILCSVFFVQVPHPCCRFHCMPLPQQYRCAYVMLSFSTHNIAHSELVQLSTTHTHS